MAFLNLRAEITRAGITQKDLAEKCEIPYSTWRAKISGRTPFTFAEAVKIKKILEEIQGRPLPMLEDLFKE